jgi:hypothetical protein
MDGVSGRQDSSESRATKIDKSATPEVPEQGTSAKAFYELMDVYRQATAGGARSSADEPRSDSRSPAKDQPAIVERTQPLLDGQDPSAVPKDSPAKGQAPLGLEEAYTERVMASLPEGRDPLMAPVYAALKGEAEPINWTSTEQKRADDILKAAGIKAPSPELWEAVAYAERILDRPGCRNKGTIIDHKMESIVGQSEVEQTRIGNVYGGEGSTNHFSDLYKVASSLHGQGEHSLALYYYKQGIEKIEKRASSSREVREFYSGLLGTQYIGCGAIEADRGNNYYKSADEHLSKGIRLTEETYARQNLLDSKKNRSLHFLAGACRLHAKVKDGLGDLGGAERIREKEAEYRGQVYTPKKREK